MKKLLILLLFIPLVSFGQSQEFNGIRFDAPANFKLTGDLEWRNEKEVITINPYESKITSEEYKSICEGNNRSFNKYEINGQELSSCFGVSDNISVVQFVVYLNEYSFIVSAASNDATRLATITQFMFVSINEKNDDSVTFSDGKTFKVDKLNRDLIEVVGQSYGYQLSPSTIKKFNSCFFKNIARQSSYKKYSEDLQKSLNYSDNKEKRMYYLYSIPYINISLWKCMESNESFIKEMAETDLIIPQSDIKIELIAKEILKDYKISLGQDEYNRLKDTIDWKAFSECYVRKLWETFSPKQMNNPTKRIESLVEIFMNNCMLTHTKQ